MNVYLKQVEPIVLVFQKKRQMINAVIKILKLESILLFVSLVDIMLYVLVMAMLLLVKVINFC